MLPKISYFDFVKSVQLGAKNQKLVNVRGCNGSGKSSIPLAFLEADPKAFELVYGIKGKEKVMATVFPTYGWMSMGSYRTKCGGLDSYRTKEQTIESLELLWELPFNIIMEGVIMSTIRSTYIDLFTTINKQQKSQRQILVYNLLPPLDTCLERIQKRNGGKPVKVDQVSGKWETVRKNVDYFLDAGIQAVVVDNSGVELKDTLSWFLKTVEGQLPKAASVKPVVKPKAEEPQLADDVEILTVENGGLPIVKASRLEDYPWYEHYKVPNEKVKVHKKNFELYWYWIVERMNMYHKRIVQGLPKPWTKDPILQHYRFTNALRDLDKLTIYYIENILKKIDERRVNLKQRKKEVVLNTMIYRLFVKVETWELIGFLTLDNWDKQWELAKKKLRSRRASGEPMFTASYYVNDLKAANPNPETNSNKTENAICLIEFWKEHIDEITDNVINLPTMKDLLVYLQTLPCVGHFSSYEYICDWAMCHRYTANYLFPYTDDSYVNVGPGNKKGLDFLFIDRGNLSYIECDMYLRSIWKVQMKRMGVYEQFVQQLPSVFEGQINLRTIEHASCENQKYLNAYYGTGRPKTTFTPKTVDLDELRLE